MKPTSDSAGTLAKGEDLFRAAYADTLRLWRKRHGAFNQTALSRRAGLSDQAVGSLERAERAVVLEEVLRICAALEIDFHDFLMDVQKRAFQPLAESLRAREGASEEERRAAELVSERAEELISSLAELAGSGLGEGG
jgi:transcriptional regulator with XRE-family HTH domain